MTLYIENKPKACSLEGVYGLIYSSSSPEKYVLPCVAGSTEGKYVSNVPGSSAEEYAFISASSSEEEYVSNIASSPVEEYVLNLAGSSVGEYMSNVASFSDKENVFTITSYLEGEYMFNVASSLEEDMSVVTGFLGEYVFTAAGSSEYVSAAVGSPEEEYVSDIAGSLEESSTTGFPDEKYVSNASENEHSALYSEKRFTLWEICENFINDWAKRCGFYLIKDQVTCEDGIIRRRTYLCNHSRSYESTSEKDTSIQKMRCQFLINVSCPKTNNPDKTIIVNKIVNEHNHILNCDAIEFRDEKKFTDKMIENVKFMTVCCKFGATVQRKFLEGKYLSQQIYSNDLYAVIQKFKPTNKFLFDDASRIFNWLDQKKSDDTRWVIARDCVLNNVTYKTNKYGMALSLFVGFDNDRHNVLLAQALLIDESYESHKWVFLKIIEATKVQPKVILTDTDLAVDAAIRQ
ncbi:10502_t:CDS:2, partial [Racocetra fulgida]